MIGEITAENIYKNGLKLGFDYQATSNSVQLINDVTGRNDEVLPPAIESTLAQGESSYKTYYWVHRAGDSDYWYNAGQILSTMPSAIQAAGYKSVISFRENGEETTRLSSEVNSVGAIDNMEFSDANGLYSIALEEAAFKEVGVEFFSIPLSKSSPETWTPSFFSKYKSTLENAVSKGPVLAHSGSGYRSAAYSIAYIALQSSRCSDWALQKSSEIGFFYRYDMDVQVVKFFKQVLGC